MSILAQCRLRSQHVLTPKLTADNLRWLDLSQFRSNPYFLDLFARRIEYKLGRLEISLRPGSNHLLDSQAMRDNHFTDLVGSMFATEPPCKAIGIYIHTTGGTTLNPVAKVCDANGIRIGSLLATFESHCSTVLEAWEKEAQKLRKEFEKLPGQASHTPKTGANGGSPTADVQLSSCFLNPRMIGKRLLPGDAMGLEKTSGV